VQRQVNLSFPRTRESGRVEADGGTGRLFPSATQASLAFIPAKEWTGSPPNASEVQGKWCVLVIDIINNNDQSGSGKLTFPYGAASWEMIFGNLDKGEVAFHYPQPRKGVSHFD